jgi:ribonuclease D
MNDKLDPVPNYTKAQFSGKIITITKDEQIAPAMEFIQDVRVVGFDTETKPSFKKGEFYHVSLLQLATDDHALLFRLHSLKDFTLLKILFEDKTIVKTGVAIRDDIKALQKLFHFTPHGFVELSEIAKERNMKNFGLKGMTEEILNLTLSKKAKLSNWEAHDLKTEQLQYAATDAWIGRKLYQKLNPDHT